MLLGMRDAESSLALGRMAMMPRGWPGLQECPWQGLLCRPSGHQRTAITSLPFSPFCRFPLCRQYIYGYVRMLYMCSM